MDKEPPTSIPVLDGLFGFENLLLKDPVARLLDMADVMKEFNTTADEAQQTLNDVEDTIIDTSLGWLFPWL
jgi:hypothetical protein